MEYLNIKNSVGKGVGPGKDTPYALSTDENHAYRITSYAQIEDIIETGYVKPKDDGDKVYWSQGGEGLYYVDKTRAILEVPIDKVYDGKTGAVHIEDIEAIWIFDSNQEIYINKIEDIKKVYNISKEKNFERSR